MKNKEKDKDRKGQKGAWERIFFDSFLFGKEEEKRGRKKKKKKRRETKVEDLIWVGRWVLYSAYGYYYPAILFVIVIVAYMYLLFVCLYLLVLFSIEYLLYSVLLYSLLYIL